MHNSVNFMVYIRGVQPKTSNYTEWDVFSNIPYSKIPPTVNLLCDFWGNVTGSVSGMMHTSQRHAYARTFKSIHKKYTPKHFEANYWYFNEMQ